MKFSILSLFPESISCYLSSSMLARAAESEIISVELLNPREFSEDKHKKADDEPYGGGPGMVLSVQPIISAWTQAKQEGKVKTVILSPQGTPFTNAHAKTWAESYGQIILIAGHYEGIDDRVREITEAEEVSVGDYVLTGGELPALTIVDAVTRQLPGVLGNQASLEETRSASSRVYTRPEVFEYEGEEYHVPPVLLSGDHKKIEAWRKDNSQYPQSDMPH